MNETIVQFDKIPIPYRASEYVRVYAPQPDVYTGVQTAHFTPGERFERWICNDFSILRDGDDWHMVGITHPCPPGFADCPKILYPAEQLLDIGKYAPLTVLDAHAAEVVRDGDDYYLLSVFYPENGVSAARLAFRNDD